MKKFLAVVGLAGLMALPAFAKHEVGVYCDDGARGVGAYEWLHLINESPEMNLTLIDGADVRAGALDKLEALIMPGGSSRVEYESLQDEGLVKVREFIRRGGGYVGTCAGCFLALNLARGKGKRLHVVPFDYKPAPEGTLFLNHRFTDAGKKALGITRDTWLVRYHGGSIMYPSTNKIEGANFEVWAKYANDGDAVGPVTEKNRVSGYDAIVGGTYGKGRVVVLGAHPEYFVGTVGIIDGALRYVLNDPKVRTVRRYRKPGARPIGFVPGGMREGAKAALALRACEAYDVIPVNSDAVKFNALEHLDLVVFASGKLGFTNGHEKTIFQNFLAHGGKAIAHQKGADVVREVADALAGPAPDYANLIAHRGESYDAPENTLPAYRTAVERGFGFECDIYRSKDGRLFTFHDGDLRRTTGGANTNRCTEATWAELEKCNVGGWGKWKGSKFDGTRPALLEEVLDLARPGRKIYVEVKGGDEAVAWVSTIRETVAKCPKATPETIVFICFSHKTCAELRRQMPSFGVYWLYAQKRNRPCSAEWVIERLKACNATGIDMAYNPKVVTADFIRRIRDAGYEFHVWTVDRPEVAQEALRRGAQTVTTNRAKYIYEATHAAASDNAAPNP